MAKANITAFDLQNGTDRTVYATWTWSKSNTKEYRCLWYYATGDGVWFKAEDTTVTSKQATYTAPSNATRVRFKVKPISKTYTKNKKTVSYWTADWSSYKYYSFSSNPPSTPPTPTVEIEKFKLTASVDNLDVNATKIEFQIVKDDKTIFKTGTATISRAAASYSCTVTAGGRYKVRCRAKDGSEYSDWSEYSSDLETIPAAPASIIYIKALSDTAVQIKWEKVSNASGGCEVEYTTVKGYFDSSNAVQSMTTNSWEYAEITGLETGQEYFFRVRAVNDQGKSGWSPVVSIIIGKEPSAPTTWSSTTTAIVGEDIILYWVHNAEDGSSQEYAEVEIIVNGVTYTYTVENTDNEDEKDKTSSYTIDSTAIRYDDGAVIQWRVRTAGITLAYGDWSIQRTIDVYAPPTLQLNVTDVDGNDLDALTSFPFYISGIAGPNTQTPIGYYVSIVTNESYETVDEIGNVKMITKGDTVYSEFYDTSDDLALELSAGSIDLENNVNYTVTCSVTMNSGLNAESSVDFTVGWEDKEYDPDAEIAFDEETLCVHIRPYCESEEGELYEGVTLSVYRREYDGSFVEIGSGLNNLNNTFITDPHPSLDYARYRIVAIDDATGSVSYNDIPGYLIGETAVIIQWDEVWSSFDTDSEDELEEPAWAGSMVKLPYNIDVSDSNNADVTMVKYIGRKFPVSYYGTQIGTTSSWRVDIDKSDKDTLYALRRLAVWMGDVYVREPSGSGYWANISVSFSQTHCELVIPVQFEITRVEGGA